MATIETFVVKFVSDVLGLKKGAEEVKQTTKQTNDDLQSQDKITQNLRGSVNKLAKEYGGLVASYFALRSILRNFNAATAHAVALDRVSTALGVNVEQLDAWGSAVQRNGGSAEGFHQTIKSLSIELSKFSSTGGSSIAPFFQILGIRMTDVNGKARQLFDILPELADAFQKISKGRAFELGKSLGLDEPTILLLQRGRKEVDALIAKQKELGLVSKYDTEIALKFNEAWADTAKAFRGLFTVVGSAVLPAFTKILNAFEKVVVFFKNNSTFLTGLMIALGTAIAVFLVPPLVSAAAAALVLYAPFLLIGAIVAAVAAAFALLYEDVMNFFEGNESVVGSILKKWPLIGEMIKRIVEIFKTLYNVAGKVFDFILDKIKNIISAAGKIINTVKGFFGGKTKVEIENTQKALSDATNTPLSAISSNAISNAMTSNIRHTANSVTTGPITIQTQAIDADGISRGLSKSLDAQLRQTGSSFDDGVLA